MARIRQGTRAGDQANGPTRRITAPISDALFRRVGAFSKFKGVPLGEIVETALVNYLKARDFKLGERPDEDDQAAA